MDMDRFYALKVIKENVCNGCACLDGMDKCNVICDRKDAYESIRNSTLILENLIDCESEIYPYRKTPEEFNPVSATVIRNSQAKIDVILKNQLMNRYMKQYIHSEDE